MVKDKDGSFLCPAGFPVPAGTTEWVLEKGDKGDTGEKGDDGTLSVRQRRSVTFLFVLPVLIAVVSLFGLIHYAHELSNEQKALVQVQIQSHRTGQLVERKLCATLNQLASLRPPPGNPATNPSRAYDQQLHFTLSQLHSDVGC